MDHGVVIIFAPDIIISNLVTLMIKGILLTACSFIHAIFVNALFYVNVFTMIDQLTDGWIFIFRFYCKIDAFCCVFNKAFMYVCMYVDNSVRIPACALLIVSDAAKGTKFSVYGPTTSDCWSLFWRRCHALCVPSFVDDVMFAHDGYERTIMSTTAPYVTVRETAVLGRRMRQASSVEVTAGVDQRWRSAYCQQQPVRRTERALDAYRITEKNDKMRLENHYRPYRAFAPRGIRQTSMLATLLRSIRWLRDGQRRTLYNCSKMYHGYPRFKLNNSASKLCRETENKI